MGQVFALSFSRDARSGVCSAATPKLRRFATQTSIPEFAMSADGSRRYSKI
jgi:hypothetical protein